MRRNIQRKKVLNLYAGLGGNAKDWDRNIYEVIAVELDEKIAKIYQENHTQDKVVIGDALEFLKKHRNDFDIIWASPPCQKHSVMMKATRHDVADYFDASLYQIIVFLTHFYKGKWCVENVKPYYEPLIKPTAKIGRHYFWANFEIDENFEIPNFKNFITSATSNDANKLKEWLGINYDGNVYYKNNHDPGQVLRNCIHPSLGLYILNCIK
jgi:DNA (cytosine-5)-methyltransferase 1